MAAGVALTDADRAPWLAALAAMIARELAAARPLVLACSALRHAYRDALARPGTAGELRFVHLALSPETAHARLAARAGHFMPASLVQSQFATLEIPSDAVTLGRLPPGRRVGRRGAARARLLTRGRPARGCSGSGRGGRASRLGLTATRAHPG
jgi:hypothetical protein